MLTTGRDLKSFSKFAASSGLSLVDGSININGVNYDSKVDFFFPDFDDLKDESVIFINSGSVRMSNGSIEGLIVVFDQWIRRCGEVGLKVNIPKKNMALFSKYVHFLGGSVEI